MALLSLLAGPPPSIFQSIGNALSGVYQAATSWLSGPHNMLVYTDPLVTYGNPVVRDTWGIMLAVSDSTLALLIVLAGYQVLLGGMTRRYSAALETLPQLILSFVGANISFLFARFFIDLNNLLCAILAAQVANQPVPVIPLAILAAALLQPDLNIVLLPLLSIFVLLLILLIIEMIVRLALILLLFVLLPIFFGLLALPSTRAYGRTGISAYIAAVLSQFLQLTSLTLGVRVLLPFLNLSIGGNAALSPIATLLAGIGLLYLALRIPSMLGHRVLSPIAESSQALRALIVSYLFP
jgi:hypothetical protein